MSIFRRWWGGAPVAAPPDAPAPKPPRFSRRAVSAIPAKVVARDPAYQSPWEPRKYPPGVLPDDADHLAMDDASFAAAGWAGDFHGMWAEGIGFLGYPYLAELSQRPEYRRPSEIIAEEMTRKWIRLRATGETDKSEKIAILNAEMLRFGLREKFHDAMLYDGFFGLSFLYIDIGTSDDPEEMKTPLALIPEKIKKGSLKGFQLVDPTWTAPNWYEAARPWRSDFYKPTTWFLMGRQFHRSRLLITVSRPVPDILKPAYNFGGLSLSQMLKPYVDNWLKTRQAVSDLVVAFTVFVIETDMSAMFADGGGSMETVRFEYFTKLRDNLGLMAIDKDREAFQNVSTPLGGLDKLQAQAQEHMAAVPGLPLIKIFGLTPSGLNATADNEIRVLYDMIHARQERAMGDNLTTALKVMQLNKFGEIDPEIGYEFVELWQLDSAGQAAVQKTQADAAAVWIESGVLAPEDERIRIAADPESRYYGLKGDVPEPPQSGASPDLTDPSERIDNAAEEGSMSGANAGDVAFDAAFNEADHPRGQPENAGQFAETGGGGGAQKEHESGKNAQAPSLSKPQKNALQHYTSAGSYPINDFLRNGTKVESGKYATATNLRSQADIEEVIGDLDSVFANAHLDKQTTVYRGVNDSVWATIKKRAKEGDGIGDAGFVSTTIDKKTVTASSLTHWLTITVPKGYSALPLDGIVPNRTKGEVLLNRGTRFRIVKITANNAILEVIP